jgi:DNA (cytosine-5)-methyltransferase 1
MVAGVDAWGIATKTYQHNFPTAKAFNVCMTPDTDPSFLSAYQGVDLLLASPECTNHSVAKAGKGINEESKRTAHYVARFADYLKPRWVVIENVVQIQKWDEYDQLISDLQSLGYHTAPVIMDASDYGVPQARVRLFIICDRVHQPDTDFIKQKKIPVRKIISVNRKYTSKPIDQDNFADSTVTKVNKAVARIGRGKPFIIVYYGNDNTGWQTLDRPLRTVTTVQRFGLVTWRDDTPMLRMLQIPELQKAMGFTKHYDLAFGSKRDKVKLLGNGVCPPVMETIVRKLIG